MKNILFCLAFFSSLAFCADSSQKITPMTPMVLDNDTGLLTIPNSSSIQSGYLSFVNFDIFATSATATSGATPANTPDKIVKRDPSGNFSATTITANLLGSSTTFTGALVGDITGNQGTTTIAPGAVTNAKMADVPDLTLKGNISGGVSPPSDLTPSQVNSLLPVMVGDSGAGGTKGLVTPPSAGDAAANKFLKADATWVTALTGLTPAPVGATPNANAISVSGETVTLQPASASFPGVVTTGTQTLAGAKTFSSTVDVTNGRIDRNGLKYIHNTGPTIFLAENLLVRTLEIGRAHV